MDTDRKTGECSVKSDQDLYILGTNNRIYSEIIVHIYFNAIPNQLERYYKEAR